MNERPVFSGASQAFCLSRLPLHLNHSAVCLVQNVINYKFQTLAKSFPSPRQKQIYKAHSVQEVL